MPNLHAQLNLQNEGASSMKVYLEPIPECYTIAPAQCIEIHAIFDGDTTNLYFTVAPSGFDLTVYAPGEIVGFVDCYVMCNGVRLREDESM